jgi:hypothetical protein
MMTKMFFFSQNAMISARNSSVYHARRVIGAVDDDRLGGRRYRALDVGHPWIKAAVFRRDDDGDAAHHLDHLRVTDPIGREDDHFVVGIEQRVDDVEQRLLGARRDDDILGSDQPIVIVFGVADDGLLQRGNTIGGRILDVAGIQLRRGAQQGGERRLVLGLADAQVNHGLAALTQQPRFFVHLERRRLGDRSGQLADGHSSAPLLWVSMEAFIARRQTSMSAVSVKCPT